MESYTLTANKGEWSELYALFKIFSEHSITAADKNLEPTNEQYTFLQVFREDIKDRKYTYDLHENGIVKILTEQGEVVRTVDISGLPEKTVAILRRLKESQERTFTIAEALEVMDSLMLEKIKASSDEKSDIVALVSDRVTSGSMLGFSVKSQIGSASTLLNSSLHTNFTFKIKDFTGDVSLVNEMDGKSKLRDRLRYITDNSESLEFTGISSQSFTRNLRLVDTVLPQILAAMLVEYYSGNATTIPDLCRKVGERNSFDMNEQEIAYKVKSFLRTVALGMVPSQEWDTYLSAYGGYIVVREDGMLLCYHLYNDDEFKDYLFNNTKFDTPSSSRHNFGTLYLDDGEQMLNLNLQIRFLK
jgi:hypothetical protein